MTPMLCCLFSRLVFFVSSLLLALFVFLLLSLLCPVSLLLSRFVFCLVPLSLCLVIKLSSLIFSCYSGGKGTVGRSLCDAHSLQLVSTGDLLRTHIAQRTALGQQAEAVVRAGQLVANDLLLQLLQEPLNCSRWLLDGFPRSLQQTLLLDQVIIIIMLIV